MSKEKLDQLEQELDLLEKYTREDWRQHAELSASIIRKLTTELMTEHQQTQTNKTSN